MTHAVAARGAMPRTRASHVAVREIMFTLQQQQQQRRLRLRRRSESVGRARVGVQSTVKTIWHTATGARPFYTAILRRAKIRRK